MRVKSLGLVAVLVGVSLLAAACGDDSDEPTAATTTAGSVDTTAEPAESTAAAGVTTTAVAGDAASTSTTEASEDLTPLEQVYAQVDGLEGQARFDKLLELAKQESGTVNYYTAEIEPMNVVVVDQWRKDTGLEINLFRESSNSLLERLVQEKAAGNVTPDLVLLNAISMWPAVDEGLCARLPDDMPGAEGVIDGGVYENWIVVALALYLPVWNTDRVSEDQIPTSWPDALSGRFDGTLGVEPTAWNRFASVIQHIAEDEGISEEEAIELIRPGFANARSITGHSALQGLLNTGELDAAIQYQPVADPDITAGAPVAYKPAVTPVPAEGNGVCILEGTPNPATALLFLEWRLTTGQRVGYESTSLVGSNPEYTPSAAEIIGVNEEDVYLIHREIYDERDKWIAILDDLVSETTQG